MKGTKRKKYRVVTKRSIDPEGTDHDKCQSSSSVSLKNKRMLNNRCVLQQQHVDCTITDALLKKGTKYHTVGWDVSSKDWTHMVLHLPHAEGGFGVTFNCVTKDAVFYTATSRFVVWIGVFSQERQKLWWLSVMSGLSGN